MLELGIAEVEADGPAARTGLSAGLLHHRAAMAIFSAPAFCWVTGALIAIWRRERLAPPMKTPSGPNARSDTSLTSRTARFRPQVRRSSNPTW